MLMFIFYTGGGATDVDLFLMLIGKFRKYIHTYIFNALSNRKVFGFIAF